MTSTTPSPTPSPQEKPKRPQSNWAQIISAAVGVLGFAAVSFQINLIRQNTRETTARQVYMSYSESALRNPELVEPDMKALRADRLQFVRYKNFVAHMLFAYDEILSVYDHEEWRRSFAQEIRPHMEYVCFDMTAEDDATYFEKMRTLLKETRKSCPTGQR
ncbi:hypothetical protein ACQR1W_36225 [Bradyrhizobium sp. HKCCYLS1011]|uniref:hypothetical protein n=1 Tax=Bradyrhizobium sp. HKCCYLS1011 TaxID=3420733 RepID=UPI003EBC3EE7